MDTQLAPRTNQYVVDLPLPQGFERNDRESSYTSDGTSRRIIDVYEGRAHTIKVRNFYITNMPAQKWTPAGETLSGSVYTLTFTKGSETCTVTISKKTGTNWSPPTEIRCVIESR